MCYTNRLATILIGCYHHHQARRGCFWTIGSRAVGRIVTFHQRPAQWRPHQVGEHRKSAVTVYQLCLLWVAEPSHYANLLSAAPAQQASQQVHAQAAPRWCHRGRKRNKVSSCRLLMDTYAWRQLKFEQFRIPVALGDGQSLVKSHYKTPASCSSQGQRTRLHNHFINCEADYEAENEDFPESLRHLQFAPLFQCYQFKAGPSLIKIRLYSATSLSYNWIHLSIALVSLLYNWIHLS